jgi:hypothetical protein
MLLDKLTDLKSVESGPLRFLRILRSRKMLLKKPCVVAGVAVIAAALFFPSACQAGLFDCFSPSAPAPLTYAPPYQAQYTAYMPNCDPCNPCAAPQVSYVPEVKYRWKYSRIERTEYQPVASADPCTGCPVTSYRPVTKKSLLPWLHREAYTTYRPMPYGGATPVSYMQSSYQPSYQPSYGNPCDPCGFTCDPCGGTSMAAPSLSSGCSSCTSGTTVYTDNGSMDPGYSSPSQTTFQSDWAPANTTPERRLRPEADPETENSDSETTNRPTAMPRLEIPAIPGDRTASTSRVRTVSYDEPASFSTSGNLYQAAMVIIPLRLVPVE